MPTKLPHLKPLPAVPKYRRLITGDIFFRNDIPDYVEGYIQDPKQPMLFIQQKPPCKYRSLKPCKCEYPVKLQVCNLGKELDCVACEEREL